jgi:hypothetical protein
MPRFVILEHDWPTRHWDVLLEAGAVLKAWRVLGEPVDTRPIPAEPNADHRIQYLEYEGPVSGNRGSVVRWDAGTFEWVSSDPVRVRLTGQTLRGEATIEPSGAGYLWRFQRDESAA